nr:structural maintenance of chromosomes protein 4 [Tanacetum cinerariifolium]
IKKDLMDPEKLEATVEDESLAKGSDLKMALEWWRYLKHT